MKKAAVFISILFTVCALSACNSPDINSDTSSVTFNDAKEITSLNTTKNSDTDTQTDTDTTESKKDESKNDVSDNTQSKKEEASQKGRDDVIPSRSNEYEATPNTESKKTSKPSDTNTSTDTATDTNTITDTDSGVVSDSNTDTEEKPEPPYLSGLWIVEKMLDADGNKVDGRDIYGNSFNYAGVLDLNEESEFELTIGIIPEGQVNKGLYEQRDNVLVLQYDDSNMTQVFLDVTKVDGVEMLVFPVSYAGKNYTIYFTR